jgi:DNA-binding CsgD family transcriptional regulator/tetratricopeptide (TPR) repeat protein
LGGGCWRAAVCRGWDHLSRASSGLPLLLDAAGQLELVDVRLSRDAYLAALLAASLAGRFGPGTLEVARAALQARHLPDAPRAADRLVEGLAVRFSEGYDASVPVLQSALTALREEGERTAPSVRWPWFARRVAAELFLDDTWHYLATRAVQQAREAGALGVLPIALNHLAHVRCLEGDLDGASALLDEADGISVATGTEPLFFGRLTLAGCRGIEVDALALFESTVPAVIARRGEGYVLTFAEHARAVLYNGLGRYGEALGPAQSASTRDELLMPVLSMPGVVEAATRSGQPEVANKTLERLSQRTRAAGTDFALGIEARSKALLADGEIAERLYLEAIERLARTRLAFELARARLVYGEWLRRERRRLDAGDQLRRAQEMFGSMRAEAFAGRAGRELLATGETARKRTTETRDELTAQETQIAVLARDGLSNSEIGARLFISPRTVEYHLHKVFTKLEITSREHLDRVLPVN